MKNLQQTARVGLFFLLGLALIWVTFETLNSVPCSVGVRAIVLLSEPQPEWLASFLKEIEKLLDLER